MTVTANSEIESYQGSVVFQITRKQRLDYANADFGGIGRGGNSASTSIPTEYLGSGSIWAKAWNVRVIVAGERECPPVSSEPVRWNQMVPSQS